MLTLQFEFTLEAVRFEEFLEVVLSEISGLGIEKIKWHLDLDLCGSLDALDSFVVLGLKMKRLERE